MNVSLIAQVQWFMLFVIFEILFVSEIFHQNVKAGSASNTTLQIPLIVNPSYPTIWFHVCNASGILYVRR